ncbi:hypothetical protein C8Q70DRAFT_134681 [Cubamyces menziesii]|nr:hypothetical protein C8Q70DRAFT_134681 [Cubamyces menziesii]
MHHGGGNSGSRALSPVCLPATRSPSCPSPVRGPSDVNDEKASREKTSDAPNGTLAPPGHPADDHMSTPIASLHTRPLSATRFATSDRSLAIAPAGCPCRCCSCCCYCSRYGSGTPFQVFSLSYPSVKRHHRRSRIRSRAQAGPHACPPRRSASDELPVPAAAAARPRPRTTWSTRLAPRPAAAMAVGTDSGPGRPARTQPSEEWQLRESGTQYVRRDLAHTVGSAAALHPDPAAPVLYLARARTYILTVAYRL